MTISKFLFSTVQLNFSKFDTFNLKMSKNNKTAPLPHAEVIKKILSRPKKIRSSSEWFDELGKYRDEHVKEYQEKKAEFLKAADQYRKMNMETFICHKVRLNSNYDADLDLGFLKEKERGEEEECDLLCCCSNCEPNRTGKLLRKRSLRPMLCHDKGAFNENITEPWFKRYLTLNKFIWAARAVIIQNRLLKVLNKLKTLTLDDVLIIEETAIKKKCEDYHCHPVFEKFL